MGRLTEFLAAVDAVTAAGTAMNSAADALAAENAALQAEVERLKAAQAPAPGPVEPGLRSVNRWDLVIGGVRPTSFYTHPGQRTETAHGTVFRARSGLGRCEMGLRDPRLEQVAKEPLDLQRTYRLRFAVVDGPLLANKANLLQFWAKSGENPVFACELTRDRLRVVQKITGKIDRRTLLDIPFQREAWYDVEIRATWSGSAGALGFKVALPQGEVRTVPVVLGPTTYDATPVSFRWGAYVPSYLANHEPEPVVGPEVAVLFSAVEVLE